MDYGLCKGRQVRGVPRTVLLCGEATVEKRDHVGRPGSGRFPHRARWCERLPPEG